MMPACTLAQEIADDVLNVIIVIVIIIRTA
jgi:hypothetical protein